MKIFGIGLSKTGTSSLAAALEILADGGNAADAAVAANAVQGMVARGMIGRHLEEMPADLIRLAEAERGG